jgi:hypothetical protein
MAEGVTLTEEQRLPIRELCLKSTYAFAKFVCDFPDLDGDFHGMMCRWIEKPTRLKLGLAPRSHFKSHVWTMADKLRRVTVDPNLRVCITNEVLENSIKFISVMQSIVQNPIYKWLFPENVPDPLKVRWNQTQLELKRPRKHPQPTVEVFGVGGTPTSNHYDIIVNDDLATNKARESPVVMEDAIQQRQLAWSLMVDPTTSEVHDIGTRWHPQDVHDWVLKNVKEVDFLKLSVWREPGVPWFPKRFPPHVLEQIRLEQGAVLWSLNYLNEPIGEGVSDFNINLLNHYTLIQNEKGEDVIRLEKKVGSETKTRSVLAADCLKFQLIDAGLSPESRDARTANVVVALCPPEGNEPFDIVVLESSAVKAGPAGVISAAKEVYDRWDPFSASIEVLVATSFSSTGSSANTRPCAFGNSRPIRRNPRIRGSGNSIRSSSKAASTCTERPAWTWSTRWPPTRTARRWISWMPWPMRRRCGSLRPLRMKRKSGLRGSPTSTWPTISKMRISWGRVELRAAPCSRATLG